PEGVAAVAGEEKLLEHLTLTAEPGVIGGQPASGLDFGAAVNTDAVIPQNNQFDFYDGGGLDMACLGLAQVDRQGNVNVSRFGPRLAGAGGFINISQNARAVVFAGTFTASGLEIGLEEGRLAIVKEGAHAKFIDRVEQVTFSGNRAARLGQPVLYVTERCVFQLTPDGLSLVEIAPGIDPDKDILPLMQSRPHVGEVVHMDGRIFRDAEMDLKVDLLHLDLPVRVALDANLGRLFLNFEKMRIRNDSDVAMVQRAVEAVCAPHGRKVDVVVNYDDCRIDDDVMSAWANMVSDLERRFYRNISRYAGSAFMRMKLSEVFPEHRTHIFESQRQASKYLENKGTSK
ncbi:MAG: acyl CoA:acetate/3-ketoacid CoA transferase, partial [Boseongicola sp.]|nr:acyl CoA:acetate/3-ketoacid CoA transferase [Boseongicola sp.]